MASGLIVDSIFWLQVLRSDFKIQHPLSYKYSFFFVGFPQIEKYFHAKESIRPRVGKEVKTAHRMRSSGIFYPLAYFLSPWIFLILRVFLIPIKWGGVGWGIEPKNPNEACKTGVPPCNRATVRKRTALRMRSRPALHVCMLYKVLHAQKHIQMTTHGDGGTSVLTCA